METLVATFGVQEGAGWGADPLGRGVLTRWVGAWQRTPALQRGTRCLLSPLSPLPVVLLFPQFPRSSPVSSTLFPSPQLSLSPQFPRFPSFPRSRLPPAEGPTPGTGAERRRHRGAVAGAAANRDPPDSPAGPRTEPSQPAGCRVPGGGHAGFWIPHFLSQSPPCGPCCPRSVRATEPLTVPMQPCRGCQGHPCRAPLGPAWPPTDTPAPALASWHACGYL